MECNPSISLASRLTRLSVADGALNSEVGNQHQKSSYTPFGWPSVTTSKDNNFDVGIWMTCVGWVFWCPEMAWPRGLLLGCLPSAGHPSRVDEHWVGSTITGCWVAESKLHHHCHLRHTITVIYVSTVTVIYSIVVYFILILSSVLLQHHHRPIMLFS